MVHTSKIWLLFILYLTGWKYTQCSIIIKVDILNESIALLHYDLRILYLLKWVNVKTIYKMFFLFWKLFIISIIKIHGSKLTSLMYNIVLLKFTCLFSEISKHLPLNLRCISFTIRWTPKVYSLLKIWTSLQKLWFNLELIRHLLYLPKDQLRWVTGCLIKISGFWT